MLCNSRKITTDFQSLYHHEGKEKQWNSCSVALFDFITKYWHLRLRQKVNMKCRNMELNINFLNYFFWKNMLMSVKQEAQDMLHPVCDSFFEIDMKIQPNSKMIVELQNLTQAIDPNGGVKLKLNWTHEEKCDCRIDYFSLRVVLVCSNIE